MMFELRFRQSWIFRRRIFEVVREKHGLTLKNLKRQYRPRPIDPVLLHAIEHHVKLRLVPLDHPATAEPAHDARRPVEGAEHESRAAVFVHVADGFDARARRVHVADVVGIKHAEGGGGQAFGAEVDVRAGEGGGGDLGVG